MKKRLIPALSIGIVVFLIGSLAYAADKKKKAHTVDLATDKTHEEEALKVELLNAVQEKEQKLHDDGDSVKVAADRLNINKGQLESRK